MQAAVLRMKMELKFPIPIMNWKNVFIPAGSGTTVKVEISLANEADLKQIIDMGFEAEFSANMGNLEELLEKNV